MVQMRLGKRMEGRKGGYEVELRLRDGEWRCGRAGLKGSEPVDAGRPELCDSDSTPYELAACHIPAHH